MRVIALEEAFSVSTMDVNHGSAKPSVTFRLRDAVLRDWQRRLPDFTEHRLKDMDEHGVDVQVLSLTSPGVQAEPDPAAALALARHANDVLTAVIAQNPDRFAGFAALPLQNPEGAVRELDRAINQLGFNGVLINGHTLGRYLDEPEFEFFWDALTGFDVPVYLHPSDTPIEWPLLSGRPELTGPTYAWAAETGGHALRLIFSGLFDRYPGAKVILGHMGEFLPFHMARLDARYGDMQPAEPLEKRPSEYLVGNFAITTTGVCSTPALLAATMAMGIDNVMFSIDYPFERTVHAVDFLRALPLSEPDLHKIAHGNAERLLRLTDRGSPHLGADPSYSPTTS